MAVHDESSDDALDVAAVTQIGPRLRALRQERGLSLRKTATLAGVTHGLISQLETGRTRPSIATLARLAPVLDVPLFEFFVPESPSGDQRVVRRHERTRLRHPGNTTDWLLTPEDAASFSASLTIVPPHADSGGRYAHAGGQEFVLILRGALEFGVAGKTWELHAGDAITLQAGEAHEWRNTGHEPAEIVWIVQGGHTQVEPQRVAGSAPAA